MLLVSKWWRPSLSFIFTGRLQCSLSFCRKSDYRNSYNSIQSLELSKLKKTPIWMVKIPVQVIYYFLTISYNPPEGQSQMSVIFVYSLY